MDDKEGWGLLSEHGTAIWHYYSVVGTLCGRYKMTWVGELTQDENEIVCCPICKQRLLSLRGKFVKQNLTPYEMRVLEALANGLAKHDGVAELGRMLNFHPNTIKYHRDNIFQKLGARSPANAVYIAMKRGIIE